MRFERYQIQEADRDAINLLRDFIPRQVFDAHAHFYLGESIPNFAGTGVFSRDAGTPEQYVSDMLPYLPGAQILRLNLMPMLDWAMSDPANGLRERANAHILSLLAAHPEHVGAIFVLPTDSEQEIGDMIANKGIRAIKCYCYANANCAQDWENCTIDSFLPESAWAVSSRSGLPIILHMMRPNALADEGNLSYILKMAARYPDAKLVLAHCARAFASWTVVERIKRLAGLDNIWFDLAAICESAPMAACVMHTAGKRVVWGSDYPISMHRGRAISLGTGQLWLIDDDLKAIEPQGAEPCLLAGENLLAFRQAALLLNLDRTQIEDIFYNNALRMFGLEG